MQRPQITIRRGAGVHSMTVVRDGQTHHYDTAGMTRRELTHVSRMACEAVGIVERKRSHRK